jgi:hypothetical protein
LPTAIAAADVNIDVVKKLRREIILILLENNVDKTLSFPALSLVSAHRAIQVTQTKNLNAFILQRDHRQIRGDRFFSPRKGQVRIKAES